MGKSYVIKLGKVESTVDSMDGGRVLVRLTEDNKRQQSELLQAFPLLPKTLQSPPKVGEAVLIITSELNNADSQRYYIGPIVSQMQDFNYAEYNNGLGHANSLLQGGIVEGRKPISQWSVTDGAFPDATDVAIIGRNGEDIILKDGEIDLRCGVRKQANGEEDKDLTGQVIFNHENPTYIQMRHDLDHANSKGSINIVADKINLVSYDGTYTDDAESVELIHPSSKHNSNAQKPLLTDEDISKLNQALHPLPFGDVLVDILLKMCEVIMNHVHPLGNMPMSTFTAADPNVALLSECEGRLWHEVLSRNVKIN